jgi:hypothetical protein
MLLKYNSSDNIDGRMYDDNGDITDSNENNN